MKTKTFGLIILSMFVLAAFLGMASAAVTENNVTITFNQTSIENASVGDVYSIEATIENLNESTFYVDFRDTNWDSWDAATNVSNGTSVIFTGVFTIPASKPATRGAYADIYNASNNTQLLFTIDRSVSISYANDEEGEDNETEDYELYEGDNEGELEISNLEFNVLEGFGDDEDYWYPFDEIEVEFDVENKGDWDIENIEITACLYDKDAEECIMDEDDMDLSDEDFDLDENDEETITISFIIDADELNEGNTDYEFYVAAVGSVDDKDSAYDEDDTGIQDSEEIVIVTDDDFVIITDFKTDLSASCGGYVEITADVWNVGDEDLDDDEIYLKIYSSKLGLNKIIEFDKGIDSMDSESISYAFQVSEELEEGTYKIELKVYNDEDLDDDDLFETDEEEDVSIFNTYLTVEGNCALNPDLTITANVVEGGNSGEELIITSVITNTESTAKTYTVLAADYEEWASDVVADQETIVLEAGQSTKVTFTFDVDRKADGTQNFNIEVYSEGQLAFTQPVQTSITKQANIFEGFGENQYIWFIVAANIVLLLAIIVVAVKLARR